MKKILYTDFVTTETLIENLLEKKEFKRIVTRSNLFKFWQKTVGEKYASHSRPYSMTSNGVMVIACENAIVAQELILKKAQILVKLQPYAKSLKINVKDLRFDPKKWNV